MKTKLLFASAMALFMASCSQDMEQLDQNPVANEGRGVTFSVAMNEGADTKANLSPAEGGVFNVRWFADNDKIGVLYKKDGYVQPKSGTAAEANSTTGWMGLENSTKVNPFTFRASASGTTGYFVANSENDILVLTQPDATYDEAKRPTFRAYWPMGTTLEDFASETKVTLPNLATQAQTTADGVGIIDNYSFMVSEAKSEAEYDKNDNSVSKDRFSLSFRRVNPIVYFKVKASSVDATTLNREYNRDYALNLFTNLGQLQSIKLKAEGSKKTGTTLTASKLTFNSDAAWDLAAEDIYDREKAFDEGSAGAADEITLNLSGVEWSDDAVAFMAVANVDRSAYIDAEEKETMTATYTFGSVSLAKSIETDKNWDVNEKNWYGFPTQQGYSLDEQPYIAYKYGSTTNYAIEINPSYQGSLADLFDASNELKNITKQDGSKIAKSEIAHFVSKKNITATADFAAIKSMTALTNVTLLENTTIPAEAFKGLGSLVYLNLPKVTKVDDVNAFPENNYTDVYMGAYDFSDKTGTNQTAVRDRLLKKASLVKADISAVERINAGFPTSGITFDSFSKLEEITVKNGVEVGATAFKDCEKLETVQFPKGVTNGTVNLVEGANSQFIGCKVIETIAISNTVIPDLAFKGCEALETITNAEGNAIVPTSIGISSFEDCKAIEDINLSAATTIGKAAFKGCTSLEGNNNLNESRTVLYVNAVQHVSDEAFNGCTALQYISFANATTIGVGILTGTTCTEIEFLKPFTVNSETATTASTNFFGTTAGTKLFCAKAQTGVNVNDITLTGNAAGSVAAKTSFSNITRYDK